MPFEQLSDGLYLAKRPALGAKIVEHYGVIDVGNRLGYPQSLTREQTPVVVHQTAEGLKAEYLSGEWRIEARIADEAGARARIQTAMTTPHYDLFGNNCEHFARFVATGRKESKQLHFATLFAAGIAILGLSSINDKTGSS